MKTAEPIEMPCGLMIRVGHKYHVLDGGPDHQAEGAIFGENVAAHCKVMGQFNGELCKTAEPIHVPFWVKTRVGPGNHVLDGGAEPQGKGQFSEVVRAIQKH